MHGRAREDARGRARTRGRVDENAAYLCTARVTNAVAWRRGCSCEKCALREIQDADIRKEQEKWSSRRDHIDVASVAQHAWEPRVGGSSGGGGGGGGGGSSSSSSSGGGTGCATEDLEKCANRLRRGRGCEGGALSDGGP